MKKKKILNLLRKDKEYAIRKIDISIKEWNVISNRKKFFRKDLNSQKLNWNLSSRINNYYNIHLLWSNNTIVKSMLDVEASKVLDALNGIKTFYSSISSIKPNLTHPDILKCYNTTAKNNGYKIKKIRLKEKIDVNIIDPFGNILGKQSMRIEKAFETFKLSAVDEINKLVEILEEIKERNGKIFLNEEKIYKNISLNKNNKFDINLTINNLEIIFLKNKNLTKTKDELLTVRKIINSININRPNLHNKLIQKINSKILESENTHKLFFLNKIMNTIIKKIKS